MFGNFSRFKAKQKPSRPLTCRQNEMKFLDHLWSCRSAPAPTGASPSLSSTAALPLAAAVLAVLYLATWPRLAKLDKVFSVQGSVWDDKNMSSFILSSLDQHICIIFCLHFHPCDRRMEYERYRVGIQIFCIQIEVRGSITGITGSLIF